VEGHYSAILHPRRMKFLFLIMEMKMSPKTTPLQLSKLCLSAPRRLHPSRIIQNKSMTNQIFVSCVVRHMHQSHSIPIRQTLYTGGEGFLRGVVAEAFPHLAVGVVQPCQTIEPQIDEIAAEAEDGG
jgi:hypothetical protein